MENAIFLPLVSAKAVPAASTAASVPRTNNFFIGYSSRELLISWLSMNFRDCDPVFYLLSDKSAEGRRAVNCNPMRAGDQLAVR
ncbi:hypothetical protein [Mesorhizobium sp. M8A.F.Ca.ET.165.01.1.1]|uniref:hypothetical protein n=1 Tax=Mesorhizobium sp. M8A.F.Ca.ET.165.01.1.1 TaxID=2563960 RepID=UPI00167B0F16|nr:hypothetical protein [Mesorhizobium sp. M8A.F.Ca.ET.165.01.1.1]